MSHVHCAIQGCKVNTFNKPLGVYFHPCPTSSEMRNKWLHALRNKCSLLDWTKSRICSKHFENKYFDSQRKLKDIAIPTIFPNYTKVQRFNELASKDKIDRQLNKLTQTELLEDIRSSINKLKEPANFDKMISDELKCKADAPTEAQLWLIIKKQNHLNTRLLELVDHKKNIAKNLEVARSAKKDVDHNIDTYKYIVKCLQEKLVNLEEQIEILTAIEAR